MTPLKTAKNTLNQVGAQVNKPFSFLPSLLLLVFAIFFLPGIVKKWYAAYRAKKATADIQAGSIVVPSGTYTQEMNGPFIPKTTTINLNIIANSIKEAIYGNDWFGMSEDEDEMIKQIKKVPRAMIPQLADAYAKVSPKGRSLQEEYLKFIEMDELVESGVYNLINQ